MYEEPISAVTQAGAIAAVGDSSFHQPGSGRCFRRSCPKTASETMQLALLAIAVGRHQGACCHWPRTWRTEAAMFGTHRWVAVLGVALDLSAGEGVEHGS